MHRYNLYIRYGTVNNYSEMTNVVRSDLKEILPLRRSILLVVMK